MAKLIYVTNVSLDGYIEDERGAFDFPCRTTTCSHPLPTSCGPWARSSAGVGGGKPALPTDTRADLELLDERRFGNGVVLLRYRPLGQ